MNKVDDKFSSYEAEQFRNLPSRAQDIWFTWLLSQDACEVNNDAIAFVDICGFESGECESPIEKLFYFVLNIIIFHKFSSTKREFYMYLSVSPQYEIERANGKKYRVDFYIEHHSMKEGTLGLIVECDGHDFHEKTKEQVAYRNDRDMELKKLGYDVIHLSGSQIYNEPFKYARQVLEYFENTVQLDDDFEQSLKEMESLKNGRKEDVYKENN